MESKNPLQQLYKALTLLTLIAVVFSLIFGLKSLFGGSSRDMSRTISVTGTGSAFATPDIASINFTVTKEDKDITKAQDDVEAVIKKITDAITTIGIESKDVMTASYNSNPRYDYKNTCGQYGCTGGDRVLLGYEVSQSVQVTIRDLSKVGQVISALGNAGITNLYGPSFEVEDPNAPQEEARSKAIENAHAEAERLAKELGVRLGKMISFSENGNGGYPAPMYATAGAEMAMDSFVTKNSAREVTLPQGEQKITSNVVLTFKIR